MNKKAESVQFVVILCAAFILIGIGFIAFSKNPVVTSKTTYSNKLCFEVYDGKLSAADVLQCCAAIKKSDGCSSYVSDTMNDELFICKGSTDVVVNKETIGFCE